VDQTRLLALLVAQGFQHVVDIAGHARTALHRQSGRLVEDVDLRVLVQQHARQHIAIVLIADRISGHLVACLAIDLERRNADDMARLDPRVGLGAAAIDPDLPRPQQLLQMAETKSRIVSLEPAVEPHAGLAGLNRYLFYACHEPVH
jgi:hypothetical protein